MQAWSQRITKPVAPTMMRPKMDVQHDTVSSPNSTSMTSCSLGKTEGTSLTQRAVARESPNAFDSRSSFSQTSASSIHLICICTAHGNRIKRLRGPYSLSKEATFALYSFHSTSLSRCWRHLVLHCVGDSERLQGLYERSCRGTGEKVRACGWFAILHRVKLNAI